MTFFGIKLNIKLYPPIKHINDAFKTQIVSNQGVSFESIAVNEDEGCPYVYRCI